MTLSIQRIDIPSKHTHGWQARAYIAGERKRLTRFFADREYGPWRAYELAEQAEKALKKRAKGMR